MALRWQALNPAPGPDGGLAGVGPDTLVYAIGDVHGRDDLLERMLQGIAEDARGRSAKRRCLVYLGDYYSRGGQSRAVVERVLGWRPTGWEIVTLKGNHEQLLQRLLEGDWRAGRHWLDFGGDSVLTEYGVPLDNQARDASFMGRVGAQLQAAMPPAHRQFLAQLTLMHREGDYLFVHAGIQPGVPLAQQQARDLVWIRHRFLNATVDHGVLVVHGHCISAEPQILPNRIGIDTGAYASGVLTCLVLHGTARGLLQTVPA